MIRRHFTNEEIRREGLQALLDRLGPADTVRFLQQYEPGEGDYTTDRQQWLGGLSVDDIIEKAKQEGGNSDDSES